MGIYLESPGTRKYIANLFMPSICTYFNKNKAISSRFMNLAFTYIIYTNTHTMYSFIFIYNCIAFVSRTKENNNNAVRIQLATLNCVKSLCNKLPYTIYTTHSIRRLHPFSFLLFPISRILRNEKREIVSNNIMK